MLHSPFLQYQESPSPQTDGIVDIGAPGGTHAECPMLAVVMNNARHSRAGKAGMQRPALGGLLREMDVGMASGPKPGIINLICRRVQRRDNECVSGRWCARHHELP